MIDRHKKLAAKRLKELRRSSDMSQKEFAIYFGVNPTTYNRYESGDIKKMPLPLMERICSKFNLSLDWLAGIEKAEKHVDHDKYHKPTKKLMVLGRIAAGVPILAQEDILDYERVPESFPADFCLKVKGDSMIGARIYDGDIVFVRKQEDVESGEIAIVMIDQEEAVIKRVFKHPSAIVLHSENPTIQDMIFTSKDKKQITVLGKVKYVKFEAK